ncbi:hypothetical protein WDU94_010855 [Cyamophila willieti]
MSTNPSEDFRPSPVDRSLEIDTEDNDQDVAEDRTLNERTFNTNNHHSHIPHTKPSALTSFSEKLKYVFPFLKGFGSGFIGAKLKNMVYPKYNYNPKTGVYYISEKGQFVLSPRPPKTPISSLPTIEELPFLESSKVPFIVSSYPHSKTRTKIKMIPVPYNVEVEKKVPYIVKIPYDNPVPVHISEPYGVPVEKIVPYPVRVEIPDPYPVTKIVKKPYNLYYENPVPVEVEQPYTLVKEKLKPIPVETVINTPYLEPVHNSFTIELPYDKNIPIPVNPGEHNYIGGEIPFHTIQNNPVGEHSHNVPFHATPNNHGSNDLLVSSSSHIGQHPSQRLPHMMAYLQPPRLPHDNRGNGNIQTKYNHYNRNPSFPHRTSRHPKTPKIPQNIPHTFTHGTNFNHIKSQETRGITEAQFQDLVKRGQMTEALKEGQLLHEAFKQTQLQEQQLRTLLNQNQALLTNGRLPQQKQPHVYQANNNIYPEFRPLNANMNLAVLQQVNQNIPNDQFNPSTLSPITQSPNNINGFKQGNGHQYSNILQQNQPLDDHLKQLYLNNANKDNIEVVKSQSYSFKMPENAPLSALINNIESQDSDIGFSQYESTYNTISPNASTKDSELYRLHLEYKILDNLMKNIDKSKNKINESAIPENLSTTKKPYESSKNNAQEIVTVSSQTESYESSSKVDNYTMFLANVIKDSYMNKTNNAHSKQKEENNPFDSAFRVAESTHKPTLHEKTDNQKMKNNGLTKNKESTTEPTLEYIVGNPNSHNYGPFYNAFSSNAMPFEKHANEPDTRTKPGQENVHVIYGHKMNAADSDGYNLNDIKNINQFENNKDNSFGFETHVGRPFYDHSKTSTESYFDWIPKTNAEPIESTSQLSTGNKSYENYHGYYKKQLEKWTFNDTDGSNSAINYGKLNDFLDIMSNNGTKGKVDSFTSTTTESLNNIIFNDIKKHLDLSLDMNGAKSMKIDPKVSRKDESLGENRNEFDKSVNNTKYKNITVKQYANNNPIKDTNDDTKPVHSALVNTSPPKVVENKKKGETIRSRGYSKSRKPVDSHVSETTFSEYSNVRRGKIAVVSENTSKSPVNVENDKIENQNKNTKIAVVSENTSKSPVNVENDKIENKNKKTGDGQKENKGIDSFLLEDDRSSDFESKVTKKPTPKESIIHEMVEHENHKTEVKETLIPENTMSLVPKSLISSTLLPIITSTPTPISSTEIVPIFSEPDTKRDQFKPLPSKNNPIKNTKDNTIDIFDLFNNLDEPNFMKNSHKKDTQKMHTVDLDTTSTEKLATLETSTTVSTISTSTTSLLITTMPTTVSNTSTTITKPKPIRGRGSLKAALSTDKTNKIDGDSNDNTIFSIKSKQSAKTFSRNETIESSPKLESPENNKDSVFDIRKNKRKYPRPVRKHFGSDQDKAESSLSYDNVKSSNKIVHKDSHDFRPSRIFTRESTTNNSVTTASEPLASNRVTVKPIQSIERVKIKNQIKEKLENSTKRYQANLSKIKGFYNHKNSSDLLERRLKNKERLLSRFSSSTAEPSSTESSTESDE